MSNQPQINQSELSVSLDYIPQTNEKSISWDPKTNIRHLNTDPQKSNNIMSTQKFMNQIDLRCDEHLSKYKEDIQATRYCSHCKIIICDSCVIEFHNQHIHLAKTKIEDYFRKQKLDLEELRSKLNTSIKTKVNLSEISQTINGHVKVIESFFSRRKAHLEEMKEKINSVIQDEAEVVERMKEAIDIFYREEGYKRLEKPLKENEELLVQIQNFWTAWDGYTKTDKVRVLKSNKVGLFDSENNENSKMIKEATDAFMGKSKSFEMKIDEIWKGWAFTEKINDFEKWISQMKDAIINSKERINDLKYDDIIAEKVEKVAVLRKDYHVEPLPAVREKNEYVHNDFQTVIEGNAIQNSVVLGNNIIPNQLTFSNENLVQGLNMYNQQVNPMMPQAMIQPQIVNNNINNNIGFNGSGNVIPMQNQITNNIVPIENTRNTNMSYSDIPVFDYEVLIWIKPKSNELIVFSPTLGMKTQKITASSFENNLEHFDIFPENCKFVNLGSSILLTGGYWKKHLTSNCYLIIIGQVFNPGQPYEISIMPYGQMIQARERHNWIFLQDRKVVLACGGFFNNNSEYTDINQGKWQGIGSMNEPRGNATVAYISNRYVYVIGGYKILDKQQGGMYHGNCEYLDFDNKHFGWKQINFGDNTLKLSAMGVVMWSENNIIWCGGFDGQQYRKEIFKVNFNVKDNLSVEKMNKFLPGAYLFLHNSFLKIGDSAYNMELGQTLTQFSYSNLGFTSMFLTA